MYWGGGGIGLGNIPKKNIFSDCFLNMFRIRIAENKDKQRFASVSPHILNWVSLWNKYFRKQKPLIRFRTFSSRPLSHPPGYCILWEDPEHSDLKIVGFLLKFSWPPPPSFSLERFRPILQRKFMKLVCAAQCVLTYWEKCSAKRKTLPASLLTTSLLLCLLASSLTTGVPCDDGDLEDGDLDDDEAGNEDGRWPVMWVWWEPSLLPGEISVGCWRRLLCATNK